RPIHRPQRQRTGTKIARCDKIIRPMIKTTRTSTLAALLLCASPALFASGCRPAPMAPEPAVVEPQTEAPPAETPATAAPAPEPAIARVLPESLIAAPVKDPTASRRLEYDSVLHARSAAWQYRVNRRGEIVGFEFSNHGGNPILPPRRDAVKNQFFTRDFQFRFDDRARQDIYLMISDWVPARDRVFRLSEIVDTGARHIVTLPTGEEVEFDGASHEIRAGALSEAPVDLSGDRQTRRFP